ncbi:hypothetical protein [Specibacter cremeus]|uniref:hypothetical protein n=1 Tax=Specibacter cremeus TaxID=1629051 RepID=UPI000F78D7E4|nr:hypothetical protein [Specibacter cremeus]
MIQPGPALIDRTEARAAYLTVRLVSLAEVMQLVSKSPTPGVGLAGIQAALNAFAGVGVARHAAALGDQVTPVRLAAVLTDVLEAIEDSPLPDCEWGAMADVLGEDMLAKLVGASITSMHRYRSRDRLTPDHIAARLHVVTLIVADLAGSYNDFGIRRWFGRQRSVLSHRSPAELLTGDWKPDDEATRQVRALAAALLAPLAA